MTAPDYREQALLLWPKMREAGGDKHAILEILASWASRIAEERDALLREALSKNGPRAHADFCDGTKGCWMCRARALLGIEEGA